MTQKDYRFILMSTVATCPVYEGSASMKNGPFEMQYVSLPQGLFLRMDIFFERFSLSNDS